MIEQILDKVLSTAGLVAFLGWAAAIYQTTQLNKEREERERDSDNARIEAASRTKVMEGFTAAITELNRTLSILLDRVKR